MRCAAFCFPFVCLLSGCATLLPRGREAPASAEWRAGDFHVRFQAGPRGPEGGTSSVYEITHAPQGQAGRRLVMASAHSLEGFQSVTNGDPKEWIRIVEDEGGRALLIEEEIPNDCGPCSNDLWVHVNADGSIDGAYLQLPSKVTGPPGGIDYEYPKVLSLQGDMLRYSYSTGPVIAMPIGGIGKLDHPTPPG